MNLRAAIFLSAAAVYTYVVIAIENNVVLMSMSNNVDLMSKSKDYKLTAEDSGQVEKCANGSVPVNATWTPKDLSPFGDIRVCVCYTLPSVFNGGTFNFSMFIHDYSTFVFGLEGVLDCDDVKRYGLPICPLPKGTSICHICPTFSDLHGLSHVPGTYDFHLQVWNLEREEMFCVKATVTILEPTPLSDCNITTYH